MGGYQAYTGSGFWPDFTALYDNTWGSGMAGGSGWCGLGISTNFVFGQNPPYYLDNFLAFSPKFFGPPTQLANCSTTLGSQTVTVPSTNGLSAGQFLQFAGLPPGSVITALTGATTITVALAATSTVTNAPATFYTQPVVPVLVLQAYLSLAVASLVQARWFDQWAIAVAWFIAHYATLWAETDATALATAWQTVVHGETPIGAAGQAVYTLSAQPPGGVLQSLSNNGLFLTPGPDYALSGVTITLTAPSSGDALYATWPVQSQTQVPVAANAAQIAAQGVAVGILTSKSVGDVSASYQALASIEDWGQWNLTKYGQQLATAARVIGAGPAVFG